MVRSVVRRSGFGYSRSPDSSSTYNGCLGDFPGRLPCRDVRFHHRPEFHPARDPPAQPAHRVRRAGGKRRNQFVRPGQFRRLDKHHHGTTLRIVARSQHRTPDRGVRRLHFFHDKSASNQRVLQHRRRGIFPAANDCHGPAPRRSYAASLHTSKVRKATLPHRRLFRQFKCTAPRDFALPGIKRPQESPGRQRPHRPQGRVLGVSLASRPASGRPPSAKAAPPRHRPRSRLPRSGPER